MKRYRIKITDKALADMEAIYTYIALSLKAPETAREQYDRIASEIETLDRFPERYMLFDSQPEHDLGMRRLLVDRYSVAYVAGEDAVTVLRVLYSASDIISRLRNEPKIGHPQSRSE